MKNERKTQADTPLPVIDSGHTRDFLHKNSDGSTYESGSPNPQKSCGECTLCCKLLGIPEIKKPTYQWCPHACKGEGCGIYEERPQSCRDFSCLWLQTPDGNDDTLGHPSLRPDKSKVVISHLKTGPLGELFMFYVAPGFPNAWRESTRMGKLIKFFSEKYCVAVITEGTKYLMRPEAIQHRPVHIQHDSASDVLSDDNWVEIMADGSEVKVETSTKDEE